MKVQLEVFLTSVHLRLLTHTINTSTSSTTQPSAMSGKNSQKPTASTAATASGKAKKTALKIDNNFAKEELALESLLEFCREVRLRQLNSI